VSSSINGFGTQAVRIAGGKAVSRAADGSDTAPSADLTCRLSSDHRLLRRWPLPAPWLMTVSV